MTQYKIWKLVTTSQRVWRCTTCLPDMYCIKNLKILILYISMDVGMGMGMG
jgi:hypothetical protein